MYQFMIHWICKTQYRATYYKNLNNTKHQLNKCSKNHMKNYAFHDKILWCICVSTRNTKLNDKQYNNMEQEVQ